MDWEVRDAARRTSRVQLGTWMYGPAFPRGKQRGDSIHGEGQLGWQQRCESHPQTWQLKAWVYSGNCWYETRAECRNLRKANILEGFTRDWSGLKEWETREFPWWLRGKESAWQRERHRFNPWLGKIPHATEPLSLSAATTAPVGHKHWSPCSATREVTTVRPTYETRGQFPLATTREKPT